MKPRALLVSIALGLITTGALCTAYYFKYSETALYRRLIKKGDDSVAALDTVLTKSSSASSLLLFAASSVAFREARLEDSGYLFHVARLRAQLDKEMYPPTGTGGNTPMILFGAIQAQLGTVLTPAMMSDPKVFHAVVMRVKSWAPKHALIHDPGWEFSSRRSPAEVDAQFQIQRRKFLDGLEGISTLLQDEEYLAASRIVQDLYLKQGDELPSREAIRVARETMAKIETAKGIQGIASGIKQ